ncbi:hypothetical protein [Erysipelothrix rhusiopathiae]|uniref:arsenate reductase/protein-tyrosine-phosphatase family protein n=1 Tax=Erysipelothrix rhusiopathiae TaxID=1648 RepID=UPI002093D987|nr:hypothetical protein [Erysipelothrix rhusiopathiae]
MGILYILEQHLFWKRWGVSTDGLSSTQIKINDFYEYDYIIGMDKSNVENILKIAPKGTEHKVYLFLDLVDDLKGQEVPDPYYTGDFEETKNLILQGSHAWNQFLTKKNKPKFILFLCSLLIHLLKPRLGK